MKISSYFRPAVLAVAALAALALNAAPIPAESRIGGFAIGCQAYSFNRFTLFEAIEKTELTGSKVIEFFPGQALSPDQRAVKWDHNASAETIQKVKDKLAAAKVTAVNYGVVGIPKDEAEATAADGREGCPVHLVVLDDEGDRRARVEH